MTKWVTVSDDKSYGVAIHNYQKVGDPKINLTVGECVFIIKECENWYYGYSGKNKSALGVFPRSFIHIMDASLRDTACGNYVYGNQPNIVSEITSVLREWGAIWKRLYIIHNPHFKTIEHKMYELIRLRSQILSGTLPVDELKEVKRLVTWNIDAGNNLLGLDMVVRDDQGNILNPDRTSIIELFRHHENATQRILMPVNEWDSTSSYQNFSRSQNYTFFLSLRNLVCKASEDVELLITLYDQKLAKPFSENFVVRWTHDMFLNDADKRYNYRALFTDLGSKDLSREKVYLVCYVIKNSSIDSYQNSKNFMKNGNPDGINSVRKAYAIACFNLSQYFSGQMEADEDKQHFLPLLPCEKDKDTLENTLRRCFSLKEFPLKDSKGQGLVISFKLLQADMKQVREENPHLVFGNVAVVRKMGFPEVILPGDVRNDLYLTIAYGEFSKGSKNSDKNIEVLLTVCNEKGVPLQGGIILGSGATPVTEYHSVVYYHEEKPRWYETLKIVVSIDEFKGCHLKFLFRHRSFKNDSKEKNDKPFALSFVRLMQENGTTLRDERHDLFVYKVDPKKYDPTDISYLELAATESELNNGFKNSVNGLSLSNKDIFVIQTNVCSTKLTQNVDLLGLLNWVSDPNHVTDNLSALMKVEGEEVVKFLQDVLDALFNILMMNSDSDLHDEMVFNCLLYVIGLVLNRKYLHFQPVLDLYIEESFSATLAYSKLIIVLKQSINNVTSSEKDQMLSMMKSLKYIMKFITRSRYLFSQLYEGRGQEQFELLFTELLESIAAMMRHKTDSTLIVQAACLKYLPSTIPDVLKVFNPVKLSSLLMELINSLPNSRLTKQKMMTIDDIVHSPLFYSPDCRAVLLSKILQLVKQLLESSEEGRSGAEHRRYPSKSVAKIVKVLGASTSELQPPDENVSQLELCVKILSDIMDLLFKPESGDSTKDITEIILLILRTVIQTTIKMDRESPLVGHLASVMMSIYRQMTSYHFEIYINHFRTKSDLLDFLMEILLVFKDLISRPVYPVDWCEMILLQNNVILKSLRFFAQTIRNHFSQDFEHQVWNNFFHCTVSFLTQPALQLETFSPSKRWRILTRYKDMRRTAGFEIRIMWFYLGRFKIHFVPGLVSPFLEMTLIPEEELRRATIPIFFDMMQTEFYCNRDGTLEKKDDNDIKANFNEFENEMIAKLDSMVEGGRGDEQYKSLFNMIMMSLVDNHMVMKEQGTKFVSTVTRLMERLLEYRCIINDESRENRMLCTVNLLDFYNEINRKEMYIRYVNKLCTLHLECENYPEAAYSLRLHSKLLSWSDTPLSPLLRSPKYPHCETHRQLKDAFYQDMIAYFDKGKMWECALCVCKELVRQYEEETFDYTQLSLLLRRMSQFYDCIIKQLRPKPEYFRVAYYGKGFPSFLSNKVFIHRGKGYDRLSDFCSRMINQHLNAELMTKLTPPSDEILESSGQYMQINHVEPIMDERKEKLLNKSINEQILQYHKVNNIQKFQYSRPFYRNDDGEERNEISNLWLERTILEISSPLPGILKWFPVVSTETVLISPLKNAVETMQATNKGLRNMIISYKNDSSLSLNPLTMKLNGIVDPAVMGGVAKYEQAFFDSDYLEKHPEDVDLINTLKDLIASQIPLLDVGIQVHAQRIPSSLENLHKKLENQFAEMKQKTEEKYGKRQTDIKCDIIKRRRPTTAYSFSQSSEDRFSQTSVGSAEGRSIRSFVSLASPFSSTSTLVRGNSQSKTSLISAAALSSSIGLFTAPALNYGVSSQKFGTIGSITKKEKKDKKKRRYRSDSKVSLDGEPFCQKDVNLSACGNSQWYTTPINDVDNISIASAIDIAAMMPPLDLEQESKSMQYLKTDSEKEKTSSRPSSGSSLNQLDQISILSTLNRDSFGTNTDSTTTSEDDRVPPPLPAKHRELESSNSINHDIVDSPCSTPPRNSFTPPMQALIDKFQSGSEISRTSNETEEQPPTPPPKKPVYRYNHTLV